MLASPSGEIYTDVVTSKPPAGQRRMIVNADVELIEEFRVYCALQNRSMSEQLRRWMKATLRVHREAMARETGSQD